MLLSRAKLRDVLMKFMTLGYVSFVFSAILDASRFITIVEPGPLPPVIEKIRGIKLYFKITFVLQIECKCFSLLEAL